MLVHSVSSSNLSRVAYESPKLYVEFKNGGVYAYSDVTQETYDLLVKAESVGKFLNANIKPKCKYQKLSDSPFPVLTNPVPTTNVKGHISGQLSI